MFAAPTSPSTANVTACNGDDVIISATGSGSGDIVYYDNTFTEISRITMPPANTSYNIGALTTGGYTFYAAEDNGTCVSNFATISVTVSSLPTSPTSSGATACYNESVTLTASGTGTINWYSNAALTNLVDTGTTYNTPALTANTDYYVTQENANTCESAATTVSVTVLPELTGSVTNTICNEGSVMVNGNTYDAATPTGTEVFTNIGPNNCDSTVTINLNVLPALTGSVTNTICNEGSVMVNGNTYDAATPTGTEVFTNVGPNNCDSTVTINLNVLPALTGSITQTICDGDSIVVNGTTYNTSVTGATEVFTNVGPNNCDSTVTINLTVEPAIDITVSNTSPTLTANQGGASYQWLDCDNGNAVIPTETGQSYTATVNGNYAVEITVGSCVDTSACENVTGVGVSELTTQEVLVYPNPTSGIITIDLGENTHLVEYSMTTLEGRIVKQGRTTDNKIVVNLSEESSGIYFLKLGNSVYKVMKQ